jgi:hypothetical protein
LDGLKKDLAPIAIATGNYPVCAHSYRYCKRCNKKLSYRNRFMPGLSGIFS